MNAAPQQRGQERQSDRDRDDEEMIDRHERELNPRQIDVHRLPPVPVIGAVPVICITRRRADTPSIRARARPRLIRSGWCCRGPRPHSRRRRRSRPSGANMLVSH
jgi:hypothetical protein